MLSRPPQERAGYEAAITLPAPVPGIVRLAPSTRRPNPPSTQAKPPALPRSSARGVVGGSEQLPLSERRIDFSGLFAGGGEILRLARPASRSSGSGCEDLLSRVSAPGKSAVRS